MGGGMGGGMMAKAQSGNNPLAKPAPSPATAAASSSLSSALRSVGLRSNPSSSYLCASDSADSAAWPWPFLEIELNSFLKSFALKLARAAPPVLARLNDFPPAGLLRLVV